MAISETTEYFLILVLLIWSLRFYFFCFRIFIAQTIFSKQNRVNILTSKLGSKFFIILAWCRDNNFLVLVFENSPVKEHNSVTLPIVKVYHHQLFFFNMEDFPPSAFLFLSYWLISSLLLWQILQRRWITLEAQSQSSGPSRVPSPFVKKERVTSQVKSRADLNMPYPSADEPGASYMKRSEMLIISLSGLNQRFQSHV